MGCRAIRICLTRPEIFKTQLRALLRAAVYGNLSVMYPMITSTEEVEQIFAIVEEVRTELEAAEIPYKMPEQGVMIETPAAVMISDELAEMVDFFSIGTNDLTQYTHAVDRELAPAEHYYRPASKAMKKLIRMVMGAAKQGNVPVTICGLAVGNPANTAQYLHLGLRSFSVSPQNLLKVKRALLDTDAHPDATGGFTQSYTGYHLEVIFPPDLLEQVPPDLRPALTGVLAQDPRPSYQDDPERVYGMAFGGLEVKFKVCEKTLAVVSVEKSSF